MRLMTVLTVFSVLFAPVFDSRSFAATNSFTWGGDLRARVADFNRIPRQDGGIWTQNQYFRLRSRIWGRYSPTKDIGLQARATNEWRSYPSDKGSNSYRAMDELVFDNLFLDVNNLFNNRFDLRIGRQDMKYGSGKIIRLGTPLDSSRTYYFNAVKGRIKLDKLKVDLLGIYNENEDEFVLNRQDRVLMEGEEAGGGIYVMNDRFARLPQEYYYIYKHEELSQYLSHNLTDLDLHTVGVRFMPQFNESFGANVEIALQDGSRENGGSVEGRFFDASLFYRPAMLKQNKGVLDFSYYYLSGDDPGTSKEEGWHPVWARFPQYMSYTLVRSFVDKGKDFAGWSNISMPSVGLNLNLGKYFNFKLRLAKVYAPEEGPGGGKERGNLFISRLTCKINKYLEGNLHFEVLDPDDYYTTIDGNAHYTHFDLLFHF